MKKRILFFHQSGAIGGAGVSLIHILKSIDKSKYDIIVVCPRQPKDMIDALRHLNVEVIDTENTPILFPHYNGGIKHALSPRSILNIFQLIIDKKKVINIIMNVKPDIVAVNSMALSYVGKYAMDFGAKTICFDRETFQKGLFGVRTRIIKHWLSCYFDKIVFISRYDFNQLNIKCRGKKFVIFDKVDMNLYVNKNQDKHVGFCRVLYLGGISKLKGIHILFDAANHLQNDNIEFYIVCDKNVLLSKLTLLDYVMSFLRISSVSLGKISYHKIKNKHHIHLIDRKSNVEEYYSQNDIVIFPSTLAHQSRPVYEAGAAKCPIIITDFRETKEFCQNGINVITFKCNDSFDLAQKIKHLINDQHLYRTVVNNNYKNTILFHNLKDLPKELKMVFDIL